MAIERFVWTEHAEVRLGERRLGATDIEDASTRLPTSILEALLAPSAAQGAAA